MWQLGWMGSVGPTPLSCSFPTFSSFCVCQGVLQAPCSLFSSPQQDKNSSLRVHGHSGTGVSQAGVMLVAPGWAAGRGSPHHLLLAEQPPQEALAVKKNETGNAWAEVLAGFGGFTWSRTDVAGGTAQARAYGRKQLAPFVPWRLPGARDPPLAFETERRGKLPMIQVIVLLNSNQMCGACDLFCSPFTSHKLSRALPNRRSRARGASPLWHSTGVLQGDGAGVSSFIFVG